MPHDERRLTDRMLAKWSAIADGIRMPRAAEIKPEAFGDDWKHCALIELDPVLWRSRLACVGETLRNRDRTQGTPQVLNDYNEGSLIRLTAARIPSVIVKRCPIVFGGAAPHGAKTMLYRAILLPVSADNDRVDHVLGAINFRDISAAADDAPVETSVLAAATGSDAPFMALTGGRIVYPTPRK